MGNRGREGASGRWQEGSADGGGRLAGSGARALGKGASGSFSYSEAIHEALEGQPEKPHVFNAGRGGEAGCWEDEGRRRHPNGGTTPQYPARRLSDGYGYRKDEPSPSATRPPASPAPLLLRRCCCCRARLLCEAAGENPRDVRRPPLLPACQPATSDCRRAPLAARSSSSTTTTSTLHRRQPPAGERRGRKKERSGASGRERDAPLPPSLPPPFPRACLHLFP